MKRRLAVVLMVAVVAIAATAGLATAAAKTGELHVTKECSQYDGTVGSFCTITSSNVPAIRPGMRVVYLAVPANGMLDADIVLTAKGVSVASGHVLLDLSTATGSVTLSGQTGKRIFSADAVVSVDAAGVWHWDGTYTVT